MVYTHSLKTGIGLGGVLLGIVWMFFGFTTPLLAQSANTLKVSPVRTDTDVAPGTSTNVKITVTNITNASIRVHPIINDFIAGDEEGTPALILDEDQFAPKHSLKQFIAPLEDITIPANQAKTVEVVVSVPETAQAGGYFGAVRFAPTSPDGGGQVNLSASVASIILLTVPGDAVEQLRLTDFTPQQNGVAGSFFTSGAGIASFVRFENQGNTQVGPFGKLSVVQGDTVVYETDFNVTDPKEVILPDSARRWDIPFDTLSGFGYYKVLGTFTYGAQNQTVEVVSGFWVIPMQYILIAASILVTLSIAVVVVVILTVRRSRRKYSGPARARMRRSR